MMHTLSHTHTCADCRWAASPSARRSLERLIGRTSLRVCCTLGVHILRVGCHLKMHYLKQSCTAPAWLGTTCPAAAAAAAALMAPSLGVHLEPPGCLYHPHFLLNPTNTSSLPTPTSHPHFLDHGLGRQIFPSF